MVQLAAVPGAAQNAHARVAVCRAKAQIECPLGHELGAFSSRPPDYRKFDGAAASQEKALSRMLASLDPKVYLMKQPSTTWLCRDAQETCTLAMFAAAMVSTATASITARSASSKACCRHLPPATST